ncbi:hypothetical protein AM571_CH01585 [Rhizobium etli 8C-3]|uniref:Uncharacterized protein n=1 Tax=Rhizobium etli 8C-3 TaxID=538025 RepID=A0A1L5P2Q9_RHIET|nr:hypothetical protein AM571_CH01585 [Rhizobium etli 8C-3]
MEGTPILGASPPAATLVFQHRSVIAGGLVDATFVWVALKKGGSIGIARIGLAEAVDDQQTQ